MLLMLLGLFAVLSGTLVQAATSCLITKWSTVWRLDADRYRFHVAFPTARCAQRATEVDDLKNYPMAHSGEGACSLR